MLFAWVQRDGGLGYPCFLPWPSLGPPGPPGHPWVSLGLPGPPWAPLGPLGPPGPRWAPLGPPWLPWFPWPPLGGLGCGFGGWGGWAWPMILVDCLSSSLYTLCCGSSLSHGPMSFFVSVHVYPRPTSNAKK